MYAPLKFIEQIENYFKLPTARNMESIVNAKAIKFVGDYLKSNRSKLYHDYGVSRGSDGVTQEFMDYYKDMHTRFCKLTWLQGCMDIKSDFLDLIVYYDIRNIWRRNKLSYLVDNNLFESLMNMNTPKLAPLDCVTKLPANCFYIDYNGAGDKIMQDLVGTFVSTDETDDELNIVLLHLVNSSSLGRVLFSTTVLRLPLDSIEDTFSINLDGFTEKTEIECEDGIVRVMNEKSICKFLYNFLVYLSASNRDIIVSERTRKSHKKVVKNIKNKFNEVKEFDVGFAYGRAIHEGATRVKYVEDGESNNSTKDKPSGKPKSSHYRSAHWHHYWVGSGDDKKLIIKWIDGVFVKGSKDEAEKVQIHKVK